MAILLMGLNHIKPGLYTRDALNKLMTANTREDRGLVGHFGFSNIKEIEGVTQEIVNVDGKHRLRIHVKGGVDPSGVGGGIGFMNNDYKLAVPGNPLPFMPINHSLSPTYPTTKLQMGMRVKVVGRDLATRMAEHNYAAGAVSIRDTLINGVESYYEGGVSLHQTTNTVWLYKNGVSIGSNSIYTNHGIGASVSPIPFGAAITAHPSDWYVEISDMYIQYQNSDFNIYVNPEVIDLPATSIATDGSWQLTDDKGGSSDDDKLTFLEESDKPLYPSLKSPKGVDGDVRVNFNLNGLTPLAADVSVTTHKSALAQNKIRVYGGISSEELVYIGNTDEGTALAQSTSVVGFDSGGKMTVRVKVYK